MHTVYFLHLEVQILTMILFSPTRIIGIIMWYCKGIFWKELYNKLLYFIHIVFKRSSSTPGPRANGVPTCGHGRTKLIQRCGARAGEQDPGDPHIFCPAAPAQVTSFFSCPNESKSSGVWSKKEDWWCEWQWSPNTTALISMRSWPPWGHDHIRIEKHHSIAKVDSIKIGLERYCTVTFVLIYMMEGPHRGLQILDYNTIGLDHSQSQPISTDYI